ncbi:hypothetical protein DSCO28_58440 [Desulfosarcina ovata subsp. sediminis]|uniref:Phospholipase C/D domain-containing protein n=1 Tax=Desulfosarcina ovata subsp. sediminis TaxID=885957 RepID=A0A5K7ZYF3_9BACT|nr:hypothetical protein [Desulfosarcina ovata]BBO85278.1 hypothetical protein DSCO28_58440 [Desulfosarcina ovata subsp. sediminis]
MALSATHLRFAAVLLRWLPVTDRPAYFSGTLYPDSRWVSGLAREKTHADRFLNPDFAVDDFSLGWHVHCVCDRIQGQIHQDLLGDLSMLTDSERWVRLSAAKVIQDGFDAAKGDLAQQLALLVDGLAPNGEPPGSVADYFGFVRRAYRGCTARTPADYARLWADVGLDPTMITRIEDAVACMQANPVLVDALVASFDRMVSRWIEQYGNDGRGKWFR